MSNTYTCSLCENTYGKMNSEEKAIEEYKKNFPEESLDNRIIVCDDCYKGFMSLFNNGGNYYVDEKRKH